MLFYCDGEKVIEVPWCFTTNVDLYHLLSYLRPLFCLFVLFSFCAFLYTLQDSQWL